MLQASADLDFEKAMEYRDLLGSVRQVAQKQKITNSDGEDRDIIALAMDDRDAVVQVFFIRQGKLIGREHFHVSIGNEDTPREVMSTFIRQYYAGTPFIPKEIMLQMDIDDAQVIAEWLSSKRGAESIYTCTKEGKP